MNRWIVFLLCACAEPAKDSPDVTQIVVDCDSIGTHTIGVLGDSTAVPWPLDVQRMRPDLSVTSRAVSGYSTADIRAVWVEYVAPNPPQSLIVLGGVNDILRHLDMEAAFVNLSTIYTEAMALGVDVYALLTLPSGSACRPCIQDFNARLAAVEGVTVIDLWDELDGHAEYYLPADSTHHSYAGLQVIAEAVAGTIR